MEEGFCLGRKFFCLGRKAFCLGDGVLRSITIPASVKTIGSNAFDRCSGLQSITIPASVKTIGSSAFSECPGLQSITLWASSPSGYDSAPFANCTNLQKIYVLSDAVDTYKLNWPAYESKITAIANPAAVTANNVTGTFAGNWCTYYNSNANVQVDAATTIYTISATSGSTATLHEVPGKIIKAGQGVILKSTGISIELTYTSTAATDDDYTGNLLKGVNVDTPCETNVNYTLAIENGVFGLFKYSGTTLHANKAYLPASAITAAGVRGFAISYGDEATAIEKLENEARIEHEESAAAKYYNLSGQRVEQPTKGLYIRNGKKVVIK